jgi:plastocyanin
MASHSRTRIRVIGGLALLSLTLGLAACGSDEPSDDAATDQTEPAAASDTPTITAEDFAFGPATLAVDVGEAVTIQNEDGAPHTWTSDDGDFDEALAGGASVSHTFDEPGTFAYHCEIHSSMKGTVEVS